MLRINRTLLFAPLAALLVISGCKSPSSDLNPQVSATDWADVLSGQPEESDLSSNAVEESANQISTVALHGRRPALHVLRAKDNLDAILDNAPGTVLIDFYADWCGPCRRQSQVLHNVEEFAADNQARMIKVDVDAHKDLAKRFNVASLPTLVVVKDGNVVERKMGFQSETKVRDLLR